MKKYFLATFFLIVFTLTLEPARNLMSKFLMLEQPQYHQIQEGEWLSKIAIKYYGDASYWRELELINRAPNGDKIYPGESIIIPSFEAMNKIRRSQRLSSVNELIQTQESIIASGGYQRETMPVAVQPEPVKSMEITVADEPVEVTSVEVTDEEEEIVGTMQSGQSADFEQSSIDTEPVAVYDETPESDYLGGEDTDFGKTSKSNMFLYITGAIIIIAAGIFFFVRKKKSEEVQYYGDVQQLEEVKDEKNEDVKEEKEKEPFQFRQSLYTTENDDTEAKKSRKEEKVNEKEFVS